MTIKLRKKKRNDDTESLYLDIYDQGKRQYEFLRLILVPVKNQADKQKNKEVLELANKIRTKREYEANHEMFDILSPSKSRTDFMAYFQSFIDTYGKKDLRMFKSSKKQLEAFIQEQTGSKTMPARQLSENLLQKFRDHLENKFTGETPHDYFSKLKQVIRKAIKDGIIKTDPTTGIKNSRGKAKIKDVLSSEELNILAQVPTAAKEVKKAFLFCCLTGLRWCDVRILTWNSIKGEYLHIVQAKTGLQVRVNLHTSALEIIGERKAPEDLVFLLPSSTAANKALSLMVKKAGLNKDITWHCARHSFGTNIMFHHGDILSASKLLGHATLAYTQRYVRASEQMKQIAVAKLPDVSITD